MKRIGILIVSLSLLVIQSAGHSKGDESPIDFSSSASQSGSHSGSGLDSTGGSKAISVSKSVENSNPNAEVKVPKFWDMVTHLPEDWSLFAKKTVDPDNAWVVAGVLGSTALFVAYDYEMWKFSEDWYNTSTDSKTYHWHGTSIGDGYFQFAMAGTIGALGYMTSNNRALRTSSQIVEVILSTGAVVQLMKHFTGRESPFKTSTRTGRWEPFPEQVKYTKDVQKYDAVPSGHLATAYGTFMVIWDNYPEQKWIPWIGYPVTFWVAEGLAGTGLHWWSDYPIGLALGHVFAKIVVSRNHKIKPASVANEVDSPYRPHYVMVKPSPTNGQPLLTFEWRW